MSLTIELKPETEARLRDLAAFTGVEAPAYIREIVEEKLLATNLANPSFIAALGRRMKEKREREKLSLRAVAKITDVASATLARLESDKPIVPDTPAIVRIKKWLEEGDSSRLSRQEILLIEKINREVAAKTKERYHVLRAKMRDEAISDDEQAELLKLTNLMELANAERLKHLIELAQLRQVSLPTVMAQLGIKPPPVE